MFLHIIDFELNSKQTGIIMEMGGTSLSRYIEQKGTFQSLGKEGILHYLQLLGQIIEILKYIHTIGFIHRDLKPSNITILGTKAYIIDFGLAIRYDKDMVSDKQISFVGTPTFAPLAAHLKIQQKPKDDIESICYTFMYLYNSYLPWRGFQMASANQKGKNLEYLEMKK